jgi:hypothetical protein
MHPLLAKHAQGSTRKYGICCQSSHFRRCASPEHGVACGRQQGGLAAAAAGPVGSCCSAPVEQSRWQESALAWCFCPVRPTHYFCTLTLGIEQMLGLPIIRKCYWWIICCLADSVQSVVCQPCGCMMQMLQIPLGGCLICKAQGSMSVSMQQHASWVLCKFAAVAWKASPEGPETC